MEFNSFKVTIQRSFKTYAKIIAAYTKHTKTTKKQMIKTKAKSLILIKLVSMLPIRTFLKNKTSLLYKLTLKN